MFDLASSISLICCARMLLNIRDIMTLSDPRDTTKPNPWSLDSSFDVCYGSRGMNEVTLEYGSSNTDNPGLFVSDGQLMHAGPISGPPSSPRRKLKARDEEQSGAERGFRDATTSVLPNVNGNNPSPLPLPSSSNQYQYQSTGTNLDFFGRS